jgi:nucleotide-binding universal stress UspA family protein
MKILLATDGSPHAEAAAKFLCRLRCDDPIEITLLTNVYLPGAESGVMTNPMLQEYKQHQEHVAAENLKHVAPIFRGFKATITEMVAEGHVGHSIIEAAEQLKADLIVVGAKGHSAIHRMLLGSVSDYVASHAECSVLVVRPTGDKGDGETLNVTLAIDDSPPSDVAVEQLKKFHWGSDSEGQLLSVVPVFRFYRQDLMPSAIELRAEQRKGAHRHADKVIQQLRDHRPNFKANVIEAEHTGEAIVNFLGSQSSDLVVVGGGQHTSLGRMVMGSVSRYILRHANCSVWIARDRAAVTQ